MNTPVSQAPVRASTTKYESIAPVAPPEQSRASTSANDAPRSWQAGTIVWTGIVGPPIASFVLLPWLLFSNYVTSAQSFDLPSYLVVLFFFAVPLGYVFGLAPALLAGAMYSGALTVTPSLRSHALFRVCIGLVSGGLCGGLWFGVVIGTDWTAYGLAAALVMGALALRRPGRRRSEHARRSRRRL